MSEKIAIERKIKSVQKGWGDGDIFYSTYPAVVEQYLVEEIKEEIKQVSESKCFNVYRGYTDGKIVFEMGASIDITVVFW